LVSSAIAGDSPAPAQRSPVPQTEEQRGWRLAAVAIACLISVFLDQATSGMVSGVEPYMAGTLGASSDDALWLQIGYNTCYYLSLIASAWMIMKFGRRNVWMYGHVLFALACLMIATSGGFWSVVGWRMLQGLGQGTFFVCAVMTVLRVFPRPIAFVGFALFASTSLSGPAVGPAIGGWFSDQNAWPLLFVIMAAMAMVAAVIVSSALPDPPGSRVPDAPVDALGLVLALLHFFTYHFVTQEGERRNWLANPEILAVFLAFCGFTVAFVWRELWGTGNPFIKLLLFREHNLRYGALLGFVLGVPLFGANIFLEYLQVGIGLTPGLAGVDLASRVVAIVVTVPFVAYSLSRRLVDLRYFIFTGFLLVSLSYWLLYFETTPLSDFRTFVIPFVLQGFGFSLLFSPIASTVLTSIRPEDFTRGVAIFKLTLVTGGSFAATALGVIFDHRNALHLSQIAGAVTLTHPGVYNLLHEGGPSQLATLSSAVTLQSSILAYADCSQYTAILALLAAPAAIILRPPPRPQPSGSGQG
jgi:MFS transporter, DHA2 family, multidrug resistance protein